MTRVAIEFFTTVSPMPDRAKDPRAYGADILENEHAVMFDTEAEFREKVHGFL